MAIEKDILLLDVLSVASRPRCVGVAICCLALGPILPTLQTAPRCSIAADLAMLATVACLSCTRRYAWMGDALLLGLESVIGLFLGARGLCRWWTSLLKSVEAS